MSNLLLTLTKEDKKAKKERKEKQKGPQSDIHH